jgi:hypothetical protein
MPLKLARESLNLLSDWELISIYINNECDEVDLKAAVEAALRARRLPVPQPLPRRPPPLPHAPAPGSMTRQTFIEYLLLIYSLTGVLYCWFFIPLHLILGDFKVDRRHKLIQSAMALGYQALEIAAAVAISNANPF